jgi:hypothetical protein|tara:strand:+ start:296 stop:538 length:243 start_codon:yes stop_codon:yes gene_type:complete
MSKTKNYGKVDGEESLEEAVRAREITQEIMNFGVSQYQIAKIILLLSLELEDRNVSTDVSKAINPLLELNNRNNSNIILT